MKCIAVFCVNYNSYEFLDSFLCSVDKAAKYAGDVSVSVFVADNTERNIKAISTNVHNINLKIFAYNENLGYFGAVGRMMDDVPAEDFDYVIISNVDIMIEQDALAKLVSKYDRNNTVGWIAPQIYSEDEHRDRNPKIMARYSLRRLRMLRLMFKYLLLNSVYKKTLYQRKKYQVHDPGEIYSGHGSFIILTNEYFKRCDIIDYPVFLFGEEIYLAEKCRVNGLTVYYDPEIKVVDREHASTSKMPSRFYTKCNVEALSYIIRTFYR